MHSTKRTCKSGCGQEQTSKLCDTPGFPLTDRPIVQHDHRMSQKLYMPRNHPRITQTSLDLLQSWRANCDVQILIYNCDPKSPDVSDIARVTDYIVAYSCKGNTTLKEEREQNKRMIIHANNQTDNQEDVRRVCKQIMNKAASKRIISKQEAVVLLAELDLCHCSETIQSVSISNSSKVRVTSSERTTRTFIQQYANRPNQQENMSLYDYFMYVKNPPGTEKEIIPNFVGVNGTPKFPVTEGYARHVVIVYRPWRKYPRDLDWILEFNNFIHSGDCPKSAQMHYERVVQRYYNKTTHCESIASKVDHSKTEMTTEDRETIALYGLHGCADEDDYDTNLLKRINRGVNHQWDAKPKVCTTDDS